MKDLYARLDMNHREGEEDDEWAERMWERANAKGCKMFAQLKEETAEEYETRLRGTTAKVRSVRSCGKPVTHCSICSVFAPGFAT